MQIKASLRLRLQDKFLTIEIVSYFEIVDIVALNKVSDSHVQVFSITSFISEASL